MKILIVKMSPINDLNSATLRTIGIAKGLVNLGHEVTYLALSGESGVTKGNFDNIRELKEMNIVYVQGSQVREKYALIQMKKV